MKMMTVEEAFAFLSACCKHAVKGDDNQMVGYWHAVGESPQLILAEGWRMSGQSEIRLYDPETMKLAAEYKGDEASELLDIGEISSLCSLVLYEL